MSESLVVDGRFCGIVGRGQGGYLAGLVAGMLAEPVQIDFRNAIPLDVALDVEQRNDVIQVKHDEKVIVERRPGASPERTPEAVDFKTALAGRSTGEAGAREVVSDCFSCGTRPDTLRVHAGPIGDGRYATPYTPQAWTSPNGVVEPPFVWAPLDCASGWGVTWEPPHPIAVTATLTTEILEAVEPGRDYVVVAETEEMWRTRRRMAWAAMYTTTGDLVARAESLWISLEGRLTG